MSKCTIPPNVPQRGQNSGDEWRFNQPAAAISSVFSGTNWLAVNLIRFDRTHRDRREEKMNRLEFFTPVRIARGHGEPVEEIDNVGEAMTFLRHWPKGRRGPVYQCALNCCAAALAGRMSAEEARKAFTGFARITRLLDDDIALPIRGERMDSAYTPRR
jgi:hypothetical protein